MPPRHPLFEALRVALRKRRATKPLRSIADACQIDYKRLAGFLQGEVPAFDVLDLERLAVYLGLVLVPDESSKPAAKSKTR